MEKRYENALTDLLEMVAFRGHAAEAKWKIARWYKKSNFSVNIRRDLRERWTSLVTDELGWTTVPTLKLAEVGGDIFLMKDADFFPDRE
jgi:hypothetical protein